MTAPAYRVVPSPNHSARTKPITAIVIHYTGSMTTDSCVSWFRRPESKVSAHYVIGRDGEVVQMVDEARVAWHAGRSAMYPTKSGAEQEPNVNAFSIGIELVATADSGFTDRQMTSLCALIEVLVSRYRIPPDRIVGHSAIAPGRKIDPEGFAGQFDWRRVREVAATTYQATVGPFVPSPTSR